jgi:DNA topoisomerase-2
MRKVEEPSITNVGLHYTKITYEPDMDFFGMETITDGCYKKIIKRIVDCAGCNPRINFYINGKKLNIKSFDDYCKLFAADVILDRQDNWTVGIAAGTNGFKQMSFVNSVETYDGGNHVTLVTEQLILELKSHFKKKHKIDVKPADIRNHLMVFISCDLNRPQFDSQTKSKLITEQSNFSSKWVVPQKVINKILKSDIIQDVLDWVTAKEQMANMAKLRKLNKSNGKSTKSIVKFSDATSKTKRDKCMLFLAEGDSAAAAIKSARDSSIMGSYPLKGKPVNVRGMDLKKLIENKEFKELMAITGLQIGVKVKSPSDLRFGKIVIATDADLDGNHIIGLLINMLHHFWLELFELGMVYRFITPIVKVTQNKKVTSFYSSPEFEEWKDNNGAKKYTSKFYKGLGTSTSSDFKEYMSNLDKHLVPLTIEDDKDVDAIDLAFNSKRANDRKDWLNI